MTGQELSELIFKLRCDCLNREDTLRDECNLSPVEFRALTSLAADDRVSASIFADKLGLSPSRVSRVLDRMVLTGLITVTANETDRRGVFITLTESGLVQKEQIEQGQKKCYELIETKLTESVRNEIGESIKKLLAVM